MKNKKYIIALSFANYQQDKTGIPKVMMAHQQMYNREKISYIALFSIKKNILNDKIMLFCKFGLIIDGEYKGVYQMSQLIHLFHLWYKGGKTLLDIHIHHLMYTRVSLVSDLLTACPKVPVKVYLHDYYNACTGYTLLKNRDEFCEGNGFSDCCADCCFSKENKKVQNRIHSLFKRNIERITFISPSQTTKKIYTNFHPEYENRIVVIPHQKYDALYTGNLEEVSVGEKTRVAFLGMPMKHKGWNAWKKVADNCSENEYEFIVFNSSDDLYERMKKVKIGFSKENLNAMTDALRKYKIHVALLWAIWPETYSYTCFEAFSANVFIITNTKSGNIADTVRANENGIILHGEDELLDLFRNPLELRKMINEFRLSAKGGPRLLNENDEIVRKSLQHSGGYEVKDAHKFVNYPLLWILNTIYK